MNRTIRATLAAVLFAVILPLAARADTGQFNPRQFVQDIKALTKNDHRLAGFGWRAV